MLLTVFVFLAVAAVSSAIVVVLHRNPVISTMSLVVTLVATAGLFIMLGSPFLAALQILLYTGAILVLFLFVIMLLSLTDHGPIVQLSPSRVAGGLATLALLVSLVGVFRKLPASDTVTRLFSGSSCTSHVGVHRAWRTR